MGIPTATDLSAALCKGCGYPLRGIESRQCPECGRAFDPADAKTFAHGRAPGRWARWWMKPGGWFSLVLMFAATGAIAYATRTPIGPVGDWKPSFIDVPIYLNPKDWRTSLNLLTPTDSAYTAGLMAWTMLIAFWSVRLCLRSLIRLRHRGGFPLTPPRFRRFAATSILLLLSTVCIACGWQFRMGQQMAALNVKINGGLVIGSGNKPRLQEVVEQMSAAERQGLFHNAAVNAGSAELRKNAVSLFTQYDSGSGLHEMLREHLLAILPLEREPELIAWELCVLGMVAREEDADAIASYLNRPEAIIQVGAADAIILWALDITPFNIFPALSVKNLSTQATLNEMARRISVASKSDQRRRQKPRLYSGNIARQLWHQGRFGETFQQRNSAARAFAPVAPLSQHSFRVAEWGVWTPVEGVATLQEAEAIPSFAHHFTDAAFEASVEPHQYLAQLDKPVIHFYSADAMLIDLSAQIRHGNVVSTFPLPSDRSASLEASFNTLGVVSMPDAVDVIEDQSFYFDNALSERDPLFNRGIYHLPFSSDGFRWKRLLISPEKLPWMVPPELPAGEKYDWWRRMRDVPSAWISSRNESDRFLFYEGATLARPGVEVSQSDANHLLLKTRTGEEEKADVSSAGGLDALEQTGRKKVRTARRGLFVEVKGGNLSAEVVAVPASGVQAESPISYPLGTSPKLIGPAVEAHLRKQLLEAGLKEPEADAMIATWRKQFFQTDGRRFILQMSAVDSDSLCPLSVSPPPTELVRVGLIWTELPAK